MVRTGRGARVGTPGPPPGPAAGTIARVKTSASLDSETGEESDTASGPRLVVAVDGPSGAGKSSASRGAAIALGLRYLDTGSMYRALTWWLLGQGVDVSDAAAVARLAAEPVIEVGTDPRAPWTRVNGADVSAAIRTREVTAAVSAVAAVPHVRAHLIGQQRDIIANAPGIVAEGRDIGTVVAPDAPVKVFLTAESAARADRRAAEANWSAVSTANPGRPGPPRPARRAAERPGGRRGGDRLDPARPGPGGRHHRPAGP